MAIPTVLIVDDDTALLQILPETLELHIPALAIETCSSARFALERIQSQAYDVILSDVRMPDLDGLALLREAKKVQARTPFLLMSADSDQAVLRRAIDDGVFDFVQKPIDRGSFVASVKRALKLRELGRRVELHEVRIHRLSVSIAKLEALLQRGCGDLPALPVQEEGSHLVMQRSLLLEKIQKAAATAMMEARMVHQLSMKPLLAEQVQARRLVQQKMQERTRL